MMVRTLRFKPAALGQGLALLRRLGPLLVALVCCRASASDQASVGQSAEPASLPTLTKARQVLELGREEAARGYPVRLIATVTCYDARTALFFAQDDSAGVFVYSETMNYTLSPGQEIEIEGVSNPGRYSPVVVASRVRATGARKRPAPRRVTIEALATGKEDSQWVEIEAVVRSEKEDWGHLVLQLASGSSQLSARVLLFPEHRNAELAGARVRVRGVAATHYNNRGQFTGIHLIVPSWANVEPISPLPSTSTFLPVRKISTILAYSIKGEADARSRVQGTVILAVPGRRMVVRDDTGGITVFAKESSAPAGRKVDVVGFPSTGGYSPVIEDAIVSDLGPAEALQPKRVPVSALFSGELDNELVETEARLEDQGHAPDGERMLMLEADGKRFRALLGDSRAPNTKLLEGSLVRLTGVCQVLVDESRKPFAASLWLRSPADIEVVSRPAWWVARTLSWVSAGLGLCGFAALAWMIMLRRGVTRRTAAILARERALEERCRDLFENATDIILSCDLGGRLTSFNAAGESLLGYSRGEALHMDLFAFTPPAGQDLLRGAIEAHAKGRPRMEFEWEAATKEGRRAILEAVTRLAYREGEVAGLTLVARDITARRQAEEALHESEARLRRSLEERARLGRDLHDSIIQSLYAVGLGLEEARRLVQAAPQQATDRMARSVQDLNKLIREVRAFILGLEPETLEGVEFERALKRLIEDMGLAFSGDLCLKLDPRAARLLDGRQTTQVLNIAREALSNSARHASARTTTVSLHQVNGFVRFEICDDGRGFDLKKVSPSGRGLHNMAARAREMHAQLEVRSEPERGTTVVLDIPCATGNGEH